MGHFGWEGLDNDRFTFISIKILVESNSNNFLFFIYKNRKEE